MTVVTLLWMWLTPVVYQESTLLQNASHRWVVTMMHFNPAYHFITAFQTALYEAQAVTSRKWCICILITVIMNAIAIPVLRTLRSEIRDVL
jgi:ABC-type polysaccharide/polyol phosphate export permease